MVAISDQSLRGGPWKRRKRQLTWRTAASWRKEGNTGLVHSECACNESHSVESNSLWPYARLLCPWNSPGKNTGVGCHALLQEIFPTQILNLGLPHCWQILYQLNHQGSPRRMEWVAYPFSSRSSPPRNWTRISCIAGGFFTSWATNKCVWLSLLCLSQFRFFQRSQNSLCHLSANLLKWGQLGFQKTQMEHVSLHEFDSNQT